MNAIEIRNLNKRFAGFHLKDINLTLPSGCIMGLVGQNGAGKSTTINLIMNTITPDSGSIRVLGVDNRGPEFTRLKNDIGVVLDEAYFPEVLTGKNVNAVMKHTYDNWNERQFFDYLSRFSLPQDKMFKDFSRGMKMKLAIAVALSHAPRLLILDEATSGLDPLVRDEILDVFNDFTRDENHSVLLSSHIVSDLEKICDYIVFLHRGRLLLCQEKDRLLEDYVVMKLTKSQLQDIPPEAILGRRDTAYGAEVLVRRAMVTRAYPGERTTLEDIFLFLAKGA